MRTSNWACALACVLVASIDAKGQSIGWVDWTGHNPEVGSVSGSVAGDAGAVAVAYTGEIVAVVTEDLGLPYWRPAYAYRSSLVSNPPPPYDLIVLNGGPTTAVSRVQFSSPVVSPYLAIVSMGQPGVPVQYQFNAPFEIVSEGYGHFGDGTLEVLPGNVLEGFEGHGVIRFIGTHSSLEWSMPLTENWHGITVGIPSAFQFCVADVDDGTQTGTSDHAVTIEDLIYFLMRFEFGSVYADVDDGERDFFPDGGVTIEDLVYFLERFEAGC